MGQRGSLLTVSVAKTEKDSYVFFVFFFKNTHALFSFVYASVSCVNQRPTVLPGPVLIVLFVFYDLVHDCLMMMMMMMLHTRTDRKYETYTVHRRLSACA